MFKAKLMFMPLLLLLWIFSAFSAPLQPTDNYVSPCKFLSDPPPQGFKLWSDSATWNGGVIPGIGKGVDINVTIPCGVAVLLNIPSIKLNTLRVQGFLKFLDDPTLPKISVQANFILVEGQFTIGASNKQFSNTAIIELTPNTAGERTDYSFTSNSPADPDNPRNLGQKVFAVVGGQVRLHGLTTPANVPVWTKLSRTAAVGDKQLELDVSVAWPVGAEIVVATTDYSPDQSEIFVITGRSVSSTGTTLRLNKPFQFMHYGDPLGLPDGFGGYLDERAEVALLSRNIVITGTQEDPPYQDMGGHFIIFFTQTQQFIEGVEFRGMGQQGLLGRYPIHFHLDGDQSGRRGTLCRKNTIRNSNQRCVVVHGTMGVRIEENVAFNVSGHCFMTEEGGEVNNTFIRNIGITINKVKKLIPIENFPDALNETDNEPSVFWLTHPTNNLIDNVAVGSADSGIWFEMRRSVRGLSRRWEKVNWINPMYNRLGTISGNVAHSNNLNGFRLYPHGLFPTSNGFPNGTGVVSTITNLNSYKNNWMGVLSHNNQGIVFMNSTLADNKIGIFMKSVENVVLRSSRVVGLSNNLGNPTGCEYAESWVRCVPTVSCKLPLPRGEAGRSVGWVEPMYPLSGVQINQNIGNQKGIPNSIISTKFSFFNTTCRPAAAIALIGDQKLSFWNAAHRVKGLKFTRDSNRIYLAPQVSRISMDLSPLDVGEVASYYSMRDLDGSLIGSRGYVIANNPNILPVKATACSRKKEWNAFSCPNTCYRSVFLEYIEPAFYFNATAAIGDFSSIVVARVADGKSFRVDGNYRQVITSTDWWVEEKYRYFNFVVLAGMTYSISIKPSKKDPTFYPTSVSINYKDDGGCGVGTVFRFPAPTNRQWLVSPTPTVFFKQCRGSTENHSKQTSYQYICNSRVSLLEINISPQLSNYITLVSSTNSTACTSTTECGILSPGSDNWRYNTSGLELRPEYINPLFDDRSWRIGSAPFGYREYADSLQTLLPRPSQSLLTYYYRRSFSLKNVSCLTGLNIHVLLNDGIVIFVNNREVLRGNMPSGTISNSTLALGWKDGSDASSWTHFFVPVGTSNGVSLVENNNYIAAEVHAYAHWAWKSTFDIQISALHLPSSCAPAQSVPEICDGIDNNNNGLVDEDPNGLPLTRPCSNGCGTGIETCIKGAWRNCTAPSVLPERCNNQDDNCDGLIDNGLNQLDCPSGTMCFAGVCQPVTPVSRPFTVWSANASLWSYYDKGIDLDKANPLWRNGSLISDWTVGTAPFGFGYEAFFNTKIKPGTSAFTTYFRKSFDMKSADVESTFSMDMLVRRDDGVIVYLNGKEIFRDNMPFGPVDFATPATDYTASEGIWNSKFIYYDCTSCFRNTSSLLRNGVNYIAAEVHQAGQYSSDVGFDLQLTRNVIVPCSSLPGSPSTCIRAYDNDIVFFDSQATWKYLDAKLPLPPSNWMMPSFSDINWYSGNGTLGYGTSGLGTVINKGSGLDVRYTQYFRRTFTVLDANCFYTLNFTLRVVDGAVVYMNGIEAFRQNMPSGPISATTPASTWSNWANVVTILTGTWLKVGTNVIAVELHKYNIDSSDALFSIQLTGRREGLTCKPFI